MSVETEILKYASKAGLGIEVGPWFNPMAPKRDGYNCLVLDVFDVDTLRKRALDDPNVATEMVGRIEDVELLGSSVEIDKLAGAYGCAGKVDYIVSSHNFEHIPNPIQFLCGCEATLKVGGKLSMIIPDKRACFDYFRPHTTLGDWLEAFFEKRERPLMKQIFDGRHLSSQHHGSGVFSLDIDSSQLTPENRIHSGFEFWQEQIRTGSSEYHDAHCWIMTPSVFELLLLDLSMLGLTHFKILEVTEAHGCSFSTHLERMDDSWSPPISNEQYLERRSELLRKISDEIAENTHTVKRLRNQDGSVQQEIKTLTSKVEQANVERVRIEQSLNAQQMQIKNLSEQLRAMTESTSWKITGPLRKIVTALRGVKSA
jgi:hypothetical protein